MALSQKAKDAKSKGISGDSEGYVLINTSDTEPIRPHPPSSSRSRSLANLMLLALCLTVVLVLVLYLVSSAISDTREASLDAPPNNTRLRRLRRRKPIPLDLSKDPEAQPRPPRYRNLFDPSPTPTSSVRSDALETENAMATGVSLTPFTPVAEWTKKWASGVAQAEWGEKDEEDEEDSIGLDRYFFNDGVGIKRYESGAKERRWKDV